MLKLKRADYAGNYHGFTLKEGFWYGVDTDTNQYIATSGWECYGNVAMYYCINGNWELEWIDVDEDFLIENLPEVNTEDKLSFVEWLEEERGIDWSYYDNNYSEVSTREMEEEYDYYFYDGLPRFVQKYICL